MKPKLTLAAILSTTAIASGIVLGSASMAQACHWRKVNNQVQRYEQTNWLRSPWAATIILPGIAIATALSVGDRYYKR